MLKIPTRQFSTTFKRLGTTYIPLPGTPHRKECSIIEGEGIGPQLIESVMTVFDKVNVPMEFEFINPKKITKQNLKEVLGRHRCILSGPVTARSDNTVKKHESDYQIDSYDFSQGLEMYASIVHAFSIPGVESRHKNVDIVAIRENCEGEYSGIEHELVPGVVEAVKVITREKSLRIAEYAFQYAKQSNRRKVTAIHKANIMKMADGEFLSACREIAEQHPEIKFEEMIVDATCMNLTLNPQHFDVMLLPNLYGSIIRSTISGIVGGPGVTPGALIGQNNALFEQGTRMAADNLVKSADANPTGFLLAAVMMLRHVDLPQYAEMIQSAIFKVLQERRVRTPDLGGHHKTREFTQEIVNQIRDY